MITEYFLSDKELDFVNLKKMYMFVDEQETVN